jgi:hypothetical protein
MKYGSKKEAKKWSMEALGHGGLVATIPVPFDEDYEIHEEDLRSAARYVIDTKNDAIFILHPGGSPRSAHSLSLQPDRTDLVLNGDGIAWLKGGWPTG